MADRVNSLLADLKRLKVETGSLACMGCGREHNCGVHGCAVLRETADVLQEYVDRCKRYADEIMALRKKQQWISVTGAPAGDGRFCAGGRKWQADGKRHTCGFNRDRVVYAGRRLVLGYVPGMGGSEGRPLDAPSARTGGDVRWVNKAAFC